MQQRKATTHSNDLIKSLPSFPAFDELSGDITKIVMDAIPDASERESSGIVGLVDDLLKCDRQIQKLMSLARQAKQAEVSTLIAQLRDNNLISSLYRIAMAKENSDLSHAAAKFELIAKVWNNLLCDAAIAGFSESDYAACDESWWMLFLITTDHELAAAMLHAHIYQREPLQQLEPENKSYFIERTREEVLRKLLQESGFDALPEENKNKIKDRVVVIMEKEELYLMHLLQAVRTTGDFTGSTAQLSMTRRECNVAIELYRKQFLPFRLANTEEVYKKYEMSLFSAKHELASLHAPEYMRHIMAIWNEKYYNTTIDLIPMLLKSPADLRWIMQRISDPVLLARIIKHYQPKLEKSMRVNVTVSSEFDALAKDVTQLAAEAQLADDEDAAQALYALNEIDEQLQALKSHAEACSPGSVDILLQRLRQKNLFLMFYSCVLAQEGSDWTNAASWLQRIHRVWNDCLTEIALEGYRKSISSDYMCYYLFHSTKDPELAIGLLNDFIYHREPRRSILAQLFFPYNPVRARPNEKLTLVSFQSNRPALEALMISRSSQNADIFLQSLLTHGTSTAIQSLNCAGLSSTLQLMEGQLNSLFLAYKSQELQTLRMQYKSDDSSMGDLKRTLAGRQELQLLRLLRDLPAEQNVPPIIAAFTAQLPEQADLGRILKSIHHPRLLAAFLQAFQARHDRVSQHHAGLFASPISDESSTRSTCRIASPSPE